MNKHSIEILVTCPCNIFSFHLLEMVLLLLWGGEILPTAISVEP